MFQARCTATPGIKERLKSKATQLGPQGLEKNGAPIASTSLEVLTGETFLKGKAQLEGVRDMQPPLACMQYFSPTRMLKDQSPGLLRERTASFSEEEDAKRGREWNMGEGLRFGDCAGIPLPDIQGTLLSWAMVFTPHVPATSTREAKQKGKEGRDKTLSLGSPGATSWEDGASERTEDWPCSQAQTGSPLILVLAGTASPQC